MQRKSNTPRSHRPTTSGRPLELPPDRAFVLHLDVRAEPPRRVIGRIEHVTSGRVAHVASLRELLAFVAEVLRPSRGAREAHLPTRRRSAAMSSGGES